MININKSLRNDILFTPNKFSGYLVNVEASNLVLLIIVNTEIDEIIKTFTDQNGRSLEIKHKIIKHCLSINKNDALS